MLDWNLSILKVEQILFILFAFFAFAQLFYLLVVWLPVLLKNQPVEKNIIPLSVIICAKNEGLNLKRNLSAILEQDHPDFEVIVVDDGSTDNTEEVLSEYRKKFPQLKTTSIPLPSDPKFTHGKKLAVTIGVKSAKNNWLVFTDADCKPCSNQWLKSMVPHNSKTEIVLGYGPYSEKKGFLNLFIRYETVNIALMYLGFARLKVPYMGVGRNLAYNKELFIRNKGFASNYNILSGDDDLFVNETATKTNTEIQIHPDSYTYSKAEEKLSSYFKQKSRHLTTATSYKPKHVLMLGLEPISRVWFYLLFILCVYGHNFLIATLSIFGIRFFSQLTIYSLCNKKLKEPNLWLIFIFFDLMSLIFNFLAYFALIIRPKYSQWK